MVENSSQNSSESIARYCSQCGLSLIPLKTFHVARACSECGKTIHVAEPGEDGKGVKVQKGDQIIVPAGLIRMSLDPKENCTFTRIGLLDFVQMLMTSGCPQTSAELDMLLEYYEKEGYKCLRESPLLQDLDIENENDNEEIWQRLKEDNNLQEISAALMVSFVDITRKAIAENDAREAAWAAYNATIFHTMYEIKNSHFQEILWQGYLAYKFLSKVTDAAALTPAETQALEKLKPLFEKLDENVLYTWVEDGRSIGSRLGTPDLPEETLKANAKYYLSLFERRRQEKQRQDADKRQDRDLVIKFLAAGVGLGGTAITAIITVLKVFGVL
ncbi:hypothetical protein NDA03_15300 [Trichocoleus sp. Lan]|uniref:hypothetical protein n=1 Tax=Trichocoleus sp. Lan TaxID=2933927 RepID=UPI003296E2CD